MPVEVWRGDRGSIGQGVIVYGKLPRWLKRSEGAGAVRAARIVRVGSAPRGLGAKVLVQDRHLRGSLKRLQ